MSGKASRKKFDLPSNMSEILQGYLNQNPFSMFRLREIRDAYTFARLDQVSEESFEISDSVDPSAVKNVIEYNREMLRNIKQHQNSLRRPELLITALISIYNVATDVKNLKVLCIGPRTEAEFLTLMAEGFSPDNLTGLDLMSYSEFVDVGDMHAMPYADNSFDIVFVGWTLTYSRDIQRVADECRRVAKPGGYVAIGVESDGRNVSDELHGYSFDDYINIRSTDEIVDLFDGHVHAVPFRHDVHRTLRDAVDMVMVIIELK